MGLEKGIYISLDELLALQEPARYISDHLSKLTRSMIQGNRPARINGRGGVFDQIRCYTMGDDVRNIDWNVTAREGKPFIRVFNEERERALLVLVDQTANMFFATRQQLKSVVCAKIAGYMLWMAHNKKRPLGAVIAGNHDIQVIRPRTNNTHLSETLSQIATYNHKLSPEKEMHDAVGLFTQALQSLNQITPREAQVVLISDFHQISDEGWNIIEQLSQKVSVIATPVHDGIIEDLPEEGNFLATYAGFQAELDFYSHNTRDRISEKTYGRADYLRQKLAGYGISVLPFSTYCEVEEQLITGLSLSGGRSE